jgi:FHA domain-containing protein
MAATPFEHADQSSLALRAIVSEHGSQLLSRPRELANLLADLLPDAPRIARLLVIAAQDQVAGELCEHTSAGMDVSTAATMVASSFAGATMLAPEACAWVVREFALALGLVPDTDRLIVNARGAAPAAASAGVEVPTAPMSTEPAPLDPNPPPGRRRHQRTPAPAGTRQDPHPNAGPGAGRQGPAAGRQGPAAGRQGPAVARRGPVPAKPGWSAVISADRGYFDEVVAGGALSETGLSFPGTYPERSVTLAGTEMRIGRRSVSRDITPEIDLSGPPADPGISHLHAVLMAQQDGTWLLLDQGSSNGTQVNGRQVASGVPVPLRHGDRICLGVWTVLTVRAA